MNNNLNWFDTISYEGAQTADIFHSYDRYFKAIETNYILREYVISNSPRPEMLSYILYGSVEYYWVLLLVNKIYDPWYDWVMSDQAVHEYTKQKYKNVGGPNAIAFHQNEAGERFYNVIEDPNHPNMWYDKLDNFRYLQYQGPMVPWTNIEYEMELNEKRRIIQIVQPNDIRSFVNSFRQQMENTHVNIT